MRAWLRLFFYRLFALTLVVGAIFGFLTLNEPLISQQAADAARFWVTRIGVITGGAAVLLDLWIWVRP